MQTSGYRGLVRPSLWQDRTLHSMCAQVWSASLQIFLSEFSLPFAADHLVPRHRCTVRSMRRRPSTTRCCASPDATERPAAYDTAVSYRRSRLDRSNRDFHRWSRAVTSLCAPGYRRRAQLGPRSSEGPGVLDRRSNLRHHAPAVRLGPNQKFKNTSILF